MIQNLCLLVCIIFIIGLVGTIYFTKSYENYESDDSSLTKYTVILNPVEYPPDPPEITTNWKYVYCEPDRSMCLKYLHINHPRYRLNPAQAGVTPAPTA